MRNRLYVEACWACWLKWPDEHKTFPSRGFGRWPEDEPACAGRTQCRLRRARRGHRVRAPARARARCPAHRERARRARCGPSGDRMSTPEELIPFCEHPFFESAAKLLSEPDPGPTPFLVDELIVERMIAVLVAQ